MGLSENLDCGELVLRSFIFFNDKQLASDQIELLIDDILHLILSNLDAISIGLETVEAEQAELYIDLSNIFLPFFIRVTETQLKYFTNKFFKKLISQTP